MRNAVNASGHVVDLAAFNSHIGQSLQLRPYVATTTLQHSHAGNGSIAADKTMWIQNGPKDSPQTAKLTRKIRQWMRQSDRELHSIRDASAGTVYNSSLSASGKGTGYRLSS